MAKVPVQDILKRFKPVLNQQALAEALGVSQSAVSQWRTKGIPPERYAALIDLARKEGVDLTLAELDPDIARVAGQAA